MKPMLTFGTNQALPWLHCVIEWILSCCWAKCIFSVLYSSSLPFSRPLNRLLGVSGITPSSGLRLRWTQSLRSLYSTERSLHRLPGRHISQVRSNWLIWEDGIRSISLVSWIDEKNPSMPVRSLLVHITTGWSAPGLKFGFTGEKVSRLHSYWVIS